MTRINHINQQLREAGYRITPQRNAILEYLVDHENHTTVHDIHHHLQKQFPNIALSTVYKNITMLEEMGYIWELGITEGARYYDAGSISSHPHLICTHCGRIMDFKHEALDHLIHQSCKSQDFKLTRYRINLYGVCPDCQSSDKGDVKDVKA